MHGTIDKHGNVTISFNICDGSGKLRAPGDRQQWLPCECCGFVDAVDINVVSHICDACYNLHNEDFAEDNVTYAAGYAYASGYHD